MNSLIDLKEQLITSLGMSHKVLIIVNTIKIVSFQIVQADIWSRKIKNYPNLI